MDATMQKVITALQWQGSSRADINTALHDFALLPNLLDMLDNGQRCFMVPEFKSNGGQGFKQSSSFK